MMSRAETTLTARDLKTLRIHEGRFNKFAKVFFGVVPFILLVVSFLNLRTAESMGSRLGLSVSSLFHEWIDGICADAQYSGLHILAIERTSIGVVQSTTAILMGAFLLLIMRTDRRSKRMNRKILETLRRGITLEQIEDARDG